MTIRLVRIPTLILALLGGAAAAGGSILAFFQLIGQSSTGGLVVAGLGVVSMEAAHLIQVLDPSSVSLDPGTARLLTWLNGSVGTLLAAAGSIAALIPASGNTYAHLVLAALGTLQAILTASLHTLDSATNATAPAAPAAAPPPGQP